MLVRGKTIQGVVCGVMAVAACVLGMAAVRFFSDSPAYVSLRQMIPVEQSLEEAQILYQVSRSETRDCLNSSQQTAEELSCLPASVDSDTLIGYLEEYCAELAALAAATERQENQRDNLEVQGELELSAWSEDVAGIQNVEKRSIEEQRIGRFRLDFTTLLRQADEELALVEATIRDGRDIELYLTSLKHAGRMSTTAEAVRALRNELLLRASSFGERTNDILLSWK